MTRRANRYGAMIVAMRLLSFHDLKLAGWQSGVHLIEPVLRPPVEIELAPDRLAKEHDQQRRVTISPGVSGVLCKRFGLIVEPRVSRKGTSLCQHWTHRLNW